MQPIPMRLALGLAALICSPALAAAQSGPDPMRSLRNEVQISAADPMAALRAPDEAKTEGPAPNPEFGDLPDAPGAEETFYQCTACHSTAIIRQQRVTDARWDDLWTWMVEEQGMIDPEPAEKDVILTYLKTHFSSER